MINTLGFLFDGDKRAKLRFSTTTKAIIAKCLCVQHLHGSMSSSSGHLLYYKHTNSHFRNMHTGLVKICYRCGYSFFQIAYTLFYEHGSCS